MRVRHLTSLILLGVAFAAAAQTAGSFTPASAMLAARASSSAAVLSTGRILVVGTDGDGASAEVVDPASAVLATATLVPAHAGAAVTALADGRVLIVGGRTDAAIQGGADIYEPEGATIAPAAGQLVVPRFGHTATQLPNGFVLIAGGDSGSGAEERAELWDPMTGRFTTAASMLVAREAPATLLDDGTVLFVGGRLAGGLSTATVERYDPASGVFVAAGQLRVPRQEHAVTLLADGRVLITGGFDATGTPLADAEIYDPATGTVRGAGTMITARASHRAVALDGGAVLIFGGSGVEGTLSSAEIFEASTGTFAALPGLLEARSGPVAVSLSDGGVWVGGGRGSTGEPLATAERHDGRAPLRQATATTVSATATSSVYGQAVTYTAVVNGRVTPATGEVVDFYDGGVLLLGRAPVDAGGAATLTTAVTPTGTRAITAVYRGSGGSEPSASPAWSQTVARAGTTSSLSVSPLAQAYSDPVTFEAKISEARGERPAGGVVFKIGTQQMNQEPAPLEDRGNGVWSARLTLPLLESGTAGQLRPNAMMKLVTAAFTDVSPHYSVRNPGTKTLLINREDAAVAYDGPREVSTTSRASGKATIPLRATVRDIAVTSDAGADKYAGDIRLAQVMFIDRGTGLVIATVPVSADSSDTTTGTAKYDWPVDIGTAKSKSYTIGMIVTSYYMRNSTADNVTVTVSKLR